MTKAHRLYFHAPCFDGIASAALLWEHLAGTAGWSEVDLLPVNYGVNGRWLQSRIPKGSAVVDFLFHPSAALWFDHHATTFHSLTAERKYKREHQRKVWIYDPLSPSCASVIWRWARQQPASPLAHPSQELRELVDWSDKIDAARYDSVQEVHHAVAPALRINAALTIDPTPGFLQELVRGLRSRSLKAVAAHSEVQRRFAAFRRRSEEGLQRLRESAKLLDGVVVFDVDTKGVIADRFAPYFLFPRARASAGLSRSRGRIALRAMRNPWRVTPHPHLGEIAVIFGGGGHERIGSVVFDSTEEERARQALETFVSALVAEAR
jgi:hypothetical protein